jgi:hypothetical protein
LTRPEAAEARPPRAVRVARLAEERGGGEGERGSRGAGDLPRASLNNALSRVDISLNPRDSSGSRDAAERVRKSAELPTFLAFCFCTFSACHLLPCVYY